MQDDIPDQSIVNLESYLMDTKPPADKAIDFVKLAREVRRRRFEAIGDEWRKKFVQYGKHLPICRMMIDEDTGAFCTCGFIGLMRRANII